MDGGVIKQMRWTARRTRDVLIISSGVIIAHTQRRRTSTTAGGDSRAFTLPFSHKCLTRSILQDLFPARLYQNCADFPTLYCRQPHVGSGHEARHDRGTYQESLTARKITVMLSTTFHR